MGTLQVGIPSGAVAFLAEELRFNDIWVSDHVSQPATRRPLPHLFDPFLTLVTGAAVTSTIGLGTSVLVASQNQPVWLRTRPHLWTH